GLVEIAPYRGARVLAPSDEDVAEIFDYRLCLETHVARQLARDRPPQVIAALESSIDRSRRALASRRSRDFVRSLAEFSDAFAAGASNQRIRRALQDLRNLLELIGTTSLDAPRREERSVKEHEA